MSINKFQSMKTTDSIQLKPIELNAQQIAVIQEAVLISHHLNPTADLHVLNPIRYVFCLEYFFSVYKEHRKISNTERFILFEKQKYVNSSVLVAYLTEYKKDIGEIYKRESIEISPESIIDCMDDKLIIRTQKIWNACLDKQVNAIPRENVDKLIQQIYSDLNLDRSNPEIHSKIYSWKTDVSYFIIYEEFANLIRQINCIKPIKLISQQKKSCGTCNIF
ncbi:hypothetical protein TTHERM_00884670 (macronuclear) [Tetrahymena thermophila SB210]|uniref:Uncharacterized protein n=1 Tax=Tetrahymena thermophila (strain SB210) TaxID=312017 RepID=Q23A10_TETTS|nr:hypothetical protein TTHERM_00884670 [Tetrahymena thermophila SB210]EAR93353.2 hypothetical protein TTHERM_00884670 [Tetrahymena thermophila SB210]|eukprot:XP_001013598.2 hypothetical protein TTHERM_00884670 [Tetrahymena thermophila SB210]